MPFIGPYRAHLGGNISKTLPFEYAGSGPGLGIYANSAADIKSRFSFLVHKHAISQAGVGDHFRSLSGAVWNSCLGGRGRRGGGTTTRSPKWTRVQPSQIQCTTEELSISPYSSRCWGMMLLMFIGLLGAFREPRKVPHTYENMEAPAPAAPRRGGHWSLHVPCVHMYEAPRGAPGRPQAQFKLELLLSNIALIS
jgi:hypothetical protein